MPKTKFQEFIFTLITSGCIIFIMGVYNVAIHTGGLQAATFSHRWTSGGYIQSRTAFFSAGMVHRIPLRILHRQQNIQIFRVPRSQTN